QAVLLPVLGRQPLRERLGSRGPQVRRRATGLGGQARDPRRLGRFGRRHGGRRRLTHGGIEGFSDGFSGLLGGGANTLSSCCFDPWNLLRWSLSRESACSSLNTTCGVTKIASSVRFRLELRLRNRP